MPRPRDILKEIRSAVPFYADLAIGACWPPEKSPLAGTDTDLSLASDSIMKQEVITGGAAAVLLRHDDHPLEGNRHHTAH